MTTELREMQPLPDEGIGPLLRPDRLSAWSWVLAYTAILSTISVLRYHVWIANGLDLGLFEQGLWLTLHKGLMAATSYTGFPIVESGGSWLVYPLALVYGVGGVGLLLVVQAFALGLGYVFIDRIGDVLGVSRHVKHLVGIAYLLSPTILGTNLFDFHPAVLAVPLFFWMLLAVMEDKALSVAVAAVLAIAASDLAPLLVLGTGIVVWWRRMPGLGIALAAGGLLLGLVDWLVLLPAASHGSMPDWVAYYASLGTTPVQGLGAVFGHPGHLVAWVGRLRSWEYVGVFLVVPAGFLITSRSHRISAWWIPALLLMEANLLSPLPIRTSPFNEFSVAAVPFIFMALIDGLSRTPLDRRRAASLLALPLLVFAVFLWQQHRTFWRSIPPESTLLQTAVSAVPQGAPVVAQNFVIAHLSDRDQAWLPDSLENHSVPAGTYVLLDPLTTTGTTPSTVLARLSQDVLRKGQADVIFSQGGITLARLVKPIRPMGEVR